MHRIPKILIGVTTALSGAYGIAIATNLAPTYRLHVTASSQNPREFNQSYAVTQHGNPKGHVAFNHTLSVTVKIPKRTAMTDEQLLVRMVKGYYGGWVIAPERWILAAFGADIVNFEGVPKPKNIWFPASKLRENLPPLHHILIGAFQVLDSHVEGTAENHQLAPTSQSTPEALSHVDFGFGENKGTFSGINRFAVVSESGSTATSDDTGVDVDKGGRTVRLTFSAVACNPSVNEMTISRWILEAHKIYVMFLFREAVGRVLADC